MEVCSSVGKNLVSISVVAYSLFPYPPPPDNMAEGGNTIIAVSLGLRGLTNKHAILEQIAVITDHLLNVLPPSTAEICITCTWHVFRYMNL